MSRYTYACGHEGTLKNADAWKANGICPDCYHEQREQERDARA